MQLKNEAPRRSKSFHVRVGDSEASTHGSRIFHAGTTISSRPDGKFPDEEHGLMVARGSE
jgi:hypothetical protein